MRENQSDRVVDRIGAWLMPCLTTAFGLELARLLFAGLVGFLRDAQGVAALNLAPIALGLFVLGFLAGPLARLLGSRRAIIVTAGGVGLVRLIEQISTSPTLDLALSGLGMVLFLLFIPIGLGSTKPGAAPRFSVGFVLGVAFNAAVHIAARTLDLSWQPGLVPIAVVALLFGALLVALRYYLADVAETTRGPSWRQALPMMALGPWLLLQLIAFQNVARVAALTHWETPMAGALVVAGNVLGLAAAFWVMGRTRPFGLAAAAGVLLFLILLYPEPSGLDIGIASPLLLLASQVLGVLLTAVLLMTAEGAENAGVGPLTVAHSIGQILFALLTFLYYITFDIAVGFRAQALLPATALLAGLGTAMAARGTTGPRPSTGYRPALAALLLIVAPVALALTWSKPYIIQPSDDDIAIRVMDYNLHNGFNTAGRLDLEVIAQIIEENNADVVGLQEISRGWLIWGGADMLTWLSQRLHMAYVTGPTADAQWGNAVLSRYPILSSETVPLPPDDLYLLRGYIVTTIDVGAGTLTLIDTHFAHRGDHEAARELQAATLVARWDGSSATIITGDMNSAPDSSAMQSLSQAGLVNVALEICTPPVHTSPADAPRRQIDYIWASPDLDYSDCAIPNVTASDHLPVVATIQLPR